MTRTPPAAAAFTLTVFVAVVTSCSQTHHGSRQQPPRMAAILDGAAGFTGQVLGVRSGAVVFEEGRGSIDPAGSARIDSTTVFSIGSVTKRFTRAAVLLLEEQGRLSTDDAISQWLDVPDRMRGTTIDQLITMRAGFHAYHDDDGDHQRMSKEEALRRITAQELLFEPGTDEEYSNSGYTLLAMIIEEASGLPFPEFVRRQLLRPAGMLTAGFFGDTIWADARVARGRGGRSFGGNAPHLWPEPSWALMGAGGMVASARDLAAWVQAVRGGKVLGPEALAKFYPAEREFEAYAGGDDFGFETFVLELDGGTDILIVNSSAGRTSLAFVLALAEALHGRQLPEPLQRLGAAAPASEALQETGLPDTPSPATLRNVTAATPSG